MSTSTGTEYIWQSCASASACCVDGASPAFRTTAQRVETKVRACPSSTVVPSSLASTMNAYFPPCHTKNLPSNALQPIRVIRVIRGPGPGCTPPRSSALQPRAFGLSLVANAKQLAPSDPFLWRLAALLAPRHSGVSHFGRSTPISPIRPISSHQKCLNISLLALSAITRPLYDHDPKPVTLTKRHHPAPIINVKARPPRRACRASSVECRVANPCAPSPSPLAPRPNRMFLFPKAIRVIRVIRGPTPHPPN